MTAKQMTSTLDISMEPTAESWTQLDDREIVCLLILPDQGTFNYDAQNSRR